MPSTVLSKVALGAKFLELVFACVCMALFEHSYRLPPQLPSIVFGAYIIILPVLIFGAVRDCKVPRLLDLIWTFVGIALFTAAGALSLDFHLNQIHPLHTGVAMGSLAILNGCIFIVDLVVTFKDVSEYAPQ